MRFGHSLFNLFIDHTPLTEMREQVLFLDLARTWGIEHCSLRERNMQMMHCRETHSLSLFPGGCISGVFLVGVAQKSPWGVNVAGLGGEMEVLPIGEECRIRVEPLLVTVWENGWSPGHSKGGALAMSSTG